MIPRLHWGAAQTNARGEECCGDALVVVEDGHRVILSVIDGLGHGTRAHQVARLAEEYLRQNARAHSIEDLLRQLHDSLRGTRGAAVGIVEAHLDRARIDFAGVGNIGLRTICQHSFSPISLPGIVGKNFRKVQVFSHDASAGDVLVMFSDGISSRFPLEEYAHLAPGAAANEILKDHHKPVDDGTCLVMKIGPE